MAWVWLGVAGVLEIAWAVGLKHPEAMTRPLIAIAIYGCATASLYCLWVAVKGIPLGTAYTIWGGIGTLGTVALGIVYFGESASAARLGFVGLILVGIIGLYWVTE